MNDITYITGRFVDDDHVLVTSRHRDGAAARCARAKHATDTHPAWAIPINYDIPGRRQRPPRVGEVLYYYDGDGSVLAPTDQ